VGPAPRAARRFDRQSQRDATIRAITRSSRIPFERTGPQGPGDRAGDLLADTWTLLILQRALLGARRYREWKDGLGVSDASLSSRLRALTGAGVLATRPYREGGRARHEYTLTAAGRDTWELLAAIWSWEREWVPRPVPLPDPVHLGCGRPTDLVLTCGACGDPVGARDVELDRDDRRPLIGAPAARLHPRRTRATLPADPLSVFPGAMEIIGDRWGTGVLAAAFMGVRTFAVFERELAISPEVLTDRLRRFRELGVLAQEGPQYRLTPRGLATFPILACLEEWGRRWMPGDEPRTHRHKACGAPLRPALRCRACAEPLAFGTFVPAGVEVRGKRLDGG
jgi:DNA-binding HxlR family transcriptional regulator